MRAAITWTPELEARLKELRAAGLTWDGIGEAMGLSRNTVLERARKKGWTKRRGMIVEMPPVEENVRVDRPAYAAGHPATWQALNAGTVLDGAPYPYPVFA